MFPEDVDQLKRDVGITAVLNVQTEDDFAQWGIDWPRLESQYERSGIECRRVPVQDFDAEDLRQKLPRCVEVLDELLREGHVVLVHCSGGVNRSPSIAIAYLHWVQGWSLEKAAAHVRKCRSCDPYVEAIRLAGLD
jgi:protein-tyrosine phosphatase